MDALWWMSQLDLFMSLTRDLTMVTQQIFVAEEWVKDARNEAKAEAHSHAEAEKSLGTLKARKSAEAGLESTQDQAEDQCKKLYLTKIKLATQKQLVLNLKTDLEKAKVAAWKAEEAVEAPKQASYLLGVEEIEVRLDEELVKVYRDYHKVTWVEAFNLAEVLADSKWRAEVAKDKGQGKETKPPSEAKDAAKTKDAAKAKAKEAEANSKKVDPELKDTFAFQSTKKEDPPPPKAKT
nr:uncharacterized protein LOC112003488 [Quercus suber]